MIIPDIFTVFWWLCHVSHFLMWLDLTLSAHFMVRSNNMIVFPVYDILGAINTTRISEAWYGGVLQLSVIIQDNEVNVRHHFYLGAIFQRGPIWIIVHTLLFFQYQLFLQLPGITLNMYRPIWYSFTIYSADVLGEGATLIIIELSTNQYPASFRVFPEMHNIKAYLWMTSWEQLRSRVINIANIGDPCVCVFRGNAHLLPT